MSRYTTIRIAKHDRYTVETAISQLTAKGLDTMQAIANGETSFFDSGLVEDSGIWGDNLTGELGHKSSGVINRLVTLGLLGSWAADADDPSNWYFLTSLGADVANFLNGTLEWTAFEITADDAPAADADPTITVKTGSKWTYIYAADGSLLAEIRNDAQWLLDAAVLAACTK